MKGKGRMVVVAVMLTVVLVLCPAVRAGGKIEKIGRFFWREYVKTKQKDANKKQRVERAKEHQKIRRNRGDWQLDCCELLKERIGEKELTPEDMIKIRDFIDWRLPSFSIYKNKKKLKNISFKNITEEVGYKIISDELTSFDYELIYEKIKDPNYKPHWAIMIWIEIGDYGRECMLSPMVQPKVIPVPGVGVGM